MKNRIHKLGRALVRVWNEVSKYEAGEFMTTRQKSLLLDEMMRERHESKVARPVDSARSSSYPLPMNIAHDHSA